MISTNLKPDSSFPIRQDLANFPVHIHSIPRVTIDEGPYRVRFASTPEDLIAAMRLRFEIFNLELGEGLAESMATGEDRDEFDDVFHHLLVEDLTNGELIGTYRIQTVEMARENKGFYTATEYDIDLIPDDVLVHSVEVGRACILKEHRNRQVLFMLWKGLATYLLQNRKRYLFGCCSFTSQDENLAHAALAHLSAKGYLHDTISISAREEFACAEPSGSPDDIKIEIPVLFKAYLRHGAKVLSGPAIDRHFRTIDFLVMLDVRDMARRSFQLYFGDRGSELP